MIKSLISGIPKKYVILDIVGAIIFAFCYTTFSKLITQLAGKLFDDNFVVYMIGVLVFIILWNLQEFVSDIINYFTSVYIENNVFSYYINKLYKIKPSILKESNTGYIAGLVQSVTNHQQSTYQILAMGVTLDITYIIYCIVVLTKQSIYFGIILLGLYVISNVLRTTIMRKFTSKKTESLTEIESHRNKQYMDVASNINTVQKMSAMDCFDRKFDKVGKETLEKAKGYAFWNELGFMSAKSTAYMFTPIMLLTVYSLSKKGITFDTTTLAFLTSVCIQFPHNVRNLAVGLSNYKRFKVASDKLGLIVKESNARMEKAVGEFVGARIIGAEYSYKLNNKARKIVIPEFHVEKGDFVCIYGESGQGKTTLLHLLSQEIENNNTELECRLPSGEVVSYKDKRLDCVFIAQDTEMFDMSLRDNLVLGKQIEDEKLIEYLRRVGMGEWFDSQEEGLDTILGERGVFVSTGQRQRLNLIRGLLVQDKEVYLLDEPTSNVDLETEDRIVELVQEVLKDKTVLIITHRDAIKRICNKHYQFTNGVLGKVILS